MVSQKIVVSIHFETGNNNKARITNINKLKQSLKSTYSSVIVVGLERFTKAISSSETFTGCDIVCAFAVLRKALILSAFRKMMRNIECVKTFRKLSDK